MTTGRINQVTERRTTTTFRRRKSRTDSTAPFWRAIVSLNVTYVGRAKFEGTTPRYKQRTVRESPASPPRQRREPLSTAFRFPFLGIENLQTRQSHLSYEPFTRSPCVPFWTFASIYSASPIAGRSRVSAWRRSRCHGSMQTKKRIFSFFLTFGIELSLSTIYVRHALGNKAQGTKRRRCNRTETV